MRWAQKIQAGNPGLCWKVILLDMTGKIYITTPSLDVEHMSKLKQTKRKKIEKSCTSSVEIFRAFLFSSQPFICLLYLIKAANCPVQSGLLNIFPNKSSTINATLLLCVIYPAHQTRIIFIPNKPEGLWVQDSQIVMYKYILQLIHFLTWAEGR